MILTFLARRVIINHKKGEESNVAVYVGSIMGFTKLEG